jgi:nicotinamidase-related amidase
VIFASPSVDEFSGATAPRPDERFIRLPRCSIFFGTELSVVLGELQAQTLILAGGVTSVSVHSSFVDAHQNDYFCRVVEDCMTGISPEAHEAALRAMEYMQTGARRRCSDVIAALAAADRRNDSRNE